MVIREVPADFGDGMTSEEKVEFCRNYVEEIQEKSRNINKNRLLEFLRSGKKLRDFERWRR